MTSGEMKVRDRDERTLRRYLLRSLGEEEQALLEAELLRDEAVLEELEAVEDDLFHEYARGGLSDGERADFERTLLRLPGAAERLAGARALVERLGATRRAARPWARPAWLAAAAALMLAAALAWTLRGREVARAPEQARGPSTPSSTPVPAPPTTPDAPPSAHPGRPLVLALASGALRDGGRMPRVVATRGDGVLRVQLALPPGSPPPPYEGLLRTAEGATVWAGTGLRPAVRTPGTLTVDLPLEALPEADFELRLARPGPAGGQPVAEYHFRLLRD